MPETLYPFNPDWVIHPGAILKDCIDDAEPVALVFFDIDAETLAGILAGTEPITDEIAESLQDATGVSRYFWLNAEAGFREGLAAGRKWVS